MADEDKVYAGLAMDRGLAVGNSEDAFTRRALHVKVGNKISEPIPVYISATRIGTVVNNYDEILLVPSGVLTTITTYSVPLSKTFYMERVTVSGTNIAEYRVSINGVVLDKAYVWFTGGLSHTFEFESDFIGLKLISADLVEVKVKHQRPTDGDFNARIQGVLE